MTDDLSMPIKNWPTQKRPREKLLTHGAESLSDSELLAVIFGTGSGKQNALQLAQSLLEKHDSLRSLMASNLAEFSAVLGCGVARYTLLHAAVELGRRASASSLVRGERLDGPHKVGDFLHGEIRHYDQEVFAVIFLDTKHRLLAFERMFYGTIDNTTVHARQVLKRCLHHNAAAVIFAHNHPSGIAEPSNADIQITAFLREALQIVDVRVLDHIVVGGDETCSLAELGHC